MPGFNLLYNASSSSNMRSEQDLHLIYENIVEENYQINRFTLNKFLDDKIFEENDEYIIVLEGVVLNKKALLNKYSSDSWTDLVWTLFQEDKEFFNVLRGSFSGMIYDKKNNEWYIYTDHLATKHLYYYLEDLSLVVSSEIKDIYNYFKNNNIEYNLSIDSAYALLSYGNVLDDNTLCNKIKSLLPGHYLNIKENSIQSIKYYGLPLASIETSLTESEIIDELDSKFRAAVKLQFEKDKEYNYQHFVALSGGLDSRMTSWVAHDMGYTDQLNFTFSQSDFLDETIPKKIASDLKHEWIFKALDNGLFLKDIDEINLITGGNVLYYALAHGRSLYKLFNYERLGVIHTGQMGDVVINSSINSFSREYLIKRTGANSETLLKNKENLNENLSPEYIENSLLYRRELNAGNSGLLGPQQYTETISPFYDIDFFEYCLTIPIKLRMNYYIYKKWVLQKYPKAGTYVWAKTNQKLSKKNIHITFRGRSIPILKALIIFSYKLGLVKPPIQTKHHMNPYDYWYATNNDIVKFQNLYYKDNIHLLIDEKLKRECIELYEEGSSLEKNQVLTLLSALKLFF